MVRGKCGGFFFLFSFLFGITLFQSCNYAVRRGKVRTMWERRSEPKGKLRVTLILLFVARPFECILHPHVASSCSLFLSVVPPSSQQPLCNLPTYLPTYLPSFLPSFLPSGVASYISWLSKPLERLRWLRYSVSSYARFAYQTVRSLARVNQYTNTLLPKTC